MENEETNKNTSHGTLLRHFMKKESISVEEMANTLDRASGTIENWKQDEKFSKSRLTVLKYFYNIDVTQFGFSENDFKPKRGNHGNFLKFFKINQKDDEHNVSLKNYFATLIKKVTTSKKEIIIADYLARTTNERLKENKEFHIKLNYYFSELIKHFKTSTNVKYTRILCPPHIPNNSRTEDSTKEEVLNLLFISSFHHIWSCFCLDEKRFELLICSKPSQLYSFGTIDKVVAVVEFDTYHNDVPLNEKVFIYDFSNQPEVPLQGIVSSYYKELKKLIAKSNDKWGPVWKLDKAAFKSKADILKLEATTIWNQKQKKLSSLKKASKELSDINNDKSELLKQIEELTLEVKGLHRQKEVWDKKVSIFSKIPEQ